MPRSASTMRSGLPGEAGHVEDGDVVLDVERDDRGDVEVAVRPVDVRLVDTGDDVGVRDHDPGRSDPARPLEPEPAGEPEDAHDAARRGRDRRSAA